MQLSFHLDAALLGRGHLSQADLDASLKRRRTPGDHAGRPGPRAAVAFLANDPVVVGFARAQVTVLGGVAHVELVHVQYNDDGADGSEIVRGLVRTLTEDFPHVRVTRRVHRQLVLHEQPHAAHELEVLFDAGFQLSAQSCDGIDLELSRGACPVECIDAFAVPGKVASGNPAAVCLTQGSEDWMLRVAGEMNLSETAFCGNLEALRAELGNCCDSLGRVLIKAEAGVPILFNDVMAAFRSAFVFHEDTSLVLGDVVSAAKQNLGSQHLLAVSLALGLSRQATLRLWGEHYQAVLDDANGTAHPNIRNYMRGAEPIFTVAGEKAGQPIASMGAFALREFVLRFKAGNSPLAAQAAKCCFEALPKGDDALETFASLLERSSLEPLAHGTVLTKEALQVALLVKSRRLTQESVRATLKGENHVVEWAANAALPADAAEYLLRVGYSDHAALPDLAAGGSLVQGNQSLSPATPPKLSLRWFTPTVEVDLCGHATLATASALFARHRALNVVEFSTRSGVLQARRTKDGGVELNFPQLVADQPGPSAQACALAFGMPESAIVETLSNGMDLFVILKDGALISTLKPVMDRIAGLGGRCVVPTACGDAKSKSFISRAFGPNAGISEDPATGSTHCCLGPLWQTKMGWQGELLGLQHSPRGGIVRVECLEGGRVALRGTTNVAWTGVLVGL